MLPKQIQSFLENRPRCYKQKKLGNVEEGSIIVIVVVIVSYIEVGFDCRVLPENSGGNLQKIALVYYIWLDGIYMQCIVSLQWKTNTRRDVALR